MKHTILVIALFICCQQAEAQGIRKVKIEDVVKMIDTSTTPLLVNFWASWCAPCIKEIPWFEKAVAEQRATGIRMILVSLDFAADYKKKTLHQFVKKNRYASTVVWLDETNADRFCPPIDSAWGGSIPATLFVNNKTGYRKFFEHQLKEARLKMELELLLK